MEQSWNRDGATRGKVRATRRAGTLKSRTVSKANRGKSLRLRFARPVRPLLVTRSVLALDDVVDLEHLGLARKLDPDVLKHWHEALTERVELLARVPDLADSEVTVRLEGDVILESLRQPVPRLLEAADGFVVLFGSHTGRGREADGKEGVDGSSPSEGLPGTKTTPQKAAFSVAAMETADQLLHKEGVDTRREPDQPARPVKLPVGTNDQDAESLGRERSADWHRHLSLHGHRGLDQALARARHQPLQRGPGGAPAPLARGLRPLRRGGGGYARRRLLLRLSNRPRRARGSRRGARGARLGSHPRANRLAYGDSSSERGRLCRSGRAPRRPHRLRRPRRPGGGLGRDGGACGRGRTPRPGRAPAQRPLRPRAHLSGGRGRLPAAQKPLPHQPPCAFYAVPGARARAGGGDRLTRPRGHAPGDSDRPRRHRQDAARAAGGRCPG